MFEPLNYTRWASYAILNKTDSTKTYHLSIYWIIETTIYVQILILICIQAPSSDYDDPSQINLTGLDINGCFEECFNQASCLAFTFKSQSCVLKYNVSSPIPCQNDYTCAIIPRNFISLIYTY